jgi:HSP20 family protein
MLPIMRNYSPSLVDHFFGDNLFDNLFSGDFPVVKGNVPAINIVEGKENYRIEVASPGLSKEDFKIDVHNDVLTISSEKKHEHEEKNEKYMRREFSYCGFKRSFILPDSTDAEKIQASHNNGILIVSIPKKEEAKEKEPRQISIQ